MLIIACDPGTTGGFALLHHEGQLVDAFPVPLVYLGKKSVMDCSTALGRMGDFSLLMQSSGQAVIEDVNAMPGQGVASTFQFARMYGAAEGLLQTQVQPGNVTYVSPSVWKRDLNLPADKTRSWELATHIFGGDAKEKYWPRKKDNGVAEAALIGYHHIHYTLKGARR
jgi:crossover junction endodeoxyribonuclease RuvC